MTSLTTHVLDTARGCPAAGVRIDVFLIEDDNRQLAASTTTNINGRTEAPLLTDAAFISATYELVFHIGPYFAFAGPAEGSPGEPPFLDLVTVRFTVADASQHYHVPLLASPWSYSTYRGS